MATDTDVVGTDPKPGVEAFTPINTQEELDRVLSARLARERDKYKPENFDKYKQAFDELEQIKATHQAELLDAVSRAEAAEADAESAKKELSEIMATNQIAAWKGEAAVRFGVKADLIYGQTKEEIEAHAKAISEAYTAPVAPIVTKDGAGNTDSTDAYTGDLAKLVFGNQ